MTSHWKRAPGRACRAERTDGNGAVEMAADQHWAMEWAIFQHDIENAPTGWTWNPTGVAWHREPWCVEAVLPDGWNGGHVTTAALRQTKWRVVRSGEPVTVKLFDRADRARHHAEVRFDRSYGPLRGAKRPDTPRDRRLSDVRVTATVFDSVQALCKRLELPYTTVVVQSLTLLDRLDLEGLDITALLRAQGIKDVRNMTGQG